MGYKILQSLIRGFLHLVFSCKVEGLENIPKEGGAIIAVNHRSYWDVVFAGAVMPRKLRYMAKSTLFKNPFFGWLITALGAFPVQRGRGDIGAIKTALSILDSGNLMLIFPEGKRVTDGGHVRAKSGVALIAVKAEVPVIPVCISGDYKLRHRITFRIGAPINFSENYGSKADASDLQCMADKVLDTVYSLEAAK